MKITVDGMEFNISGDQDVQVINSTILAGGIKVASFNSRSTINHSANSSVIIKIEGDVKAIKCDGSVTVSGNVFGNVDCGGSATVSGDVSGSIATTIN